jgi:hypothetical protein
MGAPGWRINFAAICLSLFQTGPGNDWAWREAGSRLV